MWWIHERCCGSLENDVALYEMQLEMFKIIKICRDKQRKLSFIRRCNGSLDDMVIHKIWWLIRRFGVSLGDVVVHEEMW